MSSTLQLDQRRSILDREVAKYVGHGFRVISRTDTTAQLVKPKSPSKFWIVTFLILSILIFGLILLLMYLLFFWLIAKDQAVYLEVDEHGRITRR